MLNESAVTSNELHSDTKATLKEGLYSKATMAREVAHLGLALGMYYKYKGFIANKPLVLKDLGYYSRTLLIEPAKVVHYFAAHADYVKRVSSEFPQYMDLTEVLNPKSVYSEELLKAAVTYRKYLAAGAAYVKQVVSHDD